MTTRDRDARFAQRVRDLDWRQVFEHRRERFAPLGEEEAQRWALSSMMPAFLRAYPAFGGEYRQAAISLGRVCGADLVELVTWARRARH